MAFDARTYWEGHHARGVSLDTVGWTGLGRAFNGWMYAVRRHVFRRVVSRTIPIAADTRILDIGSGTGFYLGLWRELGVHRIEGSDLSERAVGALRSAHPRVPIHVLDIGAEVLPLAAGGYDAVSAMDMLFHIVDEDAYRRAISSLATLVRPGGYVVLTENLLDGREEKAAAQTSRSESEILGLLRAAGFELVTCAPTFVLLNGPVDSTSRWLHGWWNLLTRVVSFHEVLGWCFGAALMPLELIAVRLVSRGPSTKLLVCRAPAARD
jgi:SAM-dependent methyltransferase